MQPATIAILGSVVFLLVWVGATVLFGFAGFNVVAWIATTLVFVAMVLALAPSNKV